MAAARLLGKLSYLSEPQFPLLLSGLRETHMSRADWGRTPGLQQVLKWWPCSCLFRLCLF